MSGPKSQDHFLTYYVLWANLVILKLEFRKSDVSPAKTGVKKGKFVTFISPGSVILKILIIHKTF